MKVNGKPLQKGSCVTYGLSDEKKVRIAKNEKNMYLFAKLIQK